MADEQDQQEPEAGLPGDEAAMDPVTSGADEGSPEAAPPEPAAPGDPPQIAPAVIAAAGGDAEALANLGERTTNVLVAGLDSVVAHQVRLADVVLDIADADAVAAEFEQREHVAFELRLAFSETDFLPFAVLLPVEDVGKLFMIDTSPEQMVDDEFAQAQLEMVSAGVKELLDLAGMMLFIDHLAGAEATLSQLRLRSAGEALALVTEAAGGEPFVRIDFTLHLAEGGDPRLTMVGGAALLSRLMEQASGAAEVAGNEPLAFPSVDRPAEPAEAAGPAEPATIGGATMPAGAPPPAVHPARFPPIAGEYTAAANNQIDLIMDVSLRVSVELGRSAMTVEEVLAIGPGSVVELNKLAGEPVDILVNDSQIARGEVVVVDENFGVRVTEVLSPRTRAQAMGR